ncbi:oligosaccharide flippase family protein [Flammeovirgaceae bacterium SG7u.111]|nr:oligosaccharide flippase family protein [Flammeovirgaceae bacterium SG7u.132]WPO34530.1 oligosaccharide flippase family protein [Flammeovirgaceae bacterium SG7u.111]
MSLKESFFKNLLTVSFFAYLAQAFNYLASIFIFRIITPDEYGVVSMIVVFSGFIAIFSDAGFSFSVIRGNYNLKFLNKLSGATVIFGLLLSLLLVSMAKPISWFYNSPELFLPTICLASTFFLQSFSIIPKAKLQKEEEFKAIGIATVAMQLSNSSTQLALALSGFSFWAFIWGPIVGYIVQAIVYYRKTRLSINITSLQELKKTYTEVKSLVGNVSGFNMINYWARNSDYMMIGKLYDKATLGVYRNAYFLLMLPINFVGMVINQVFLPTIQKAVNSSRQKFEKEYIYLEGSLFLFALPLTIIFITLPKELVQLIWGNNWIAVAEYLPYFGVLCFTQTSLNPIGIGYIVLKKEHELLKIGGINAIILIIAIISGAIISTESLVFYYSIASTIIVSPIFIYFAFIKAFKFNLNKVLKNWIPKIVLCFSMLICIHFDFQSVIYLLLLLLTMITVVTEFNKISWVVKYIIRIKK